MITQRGITAVEVIFGIPEVGLPPLLVESLYVTRHCTDIYSALIASLTIQTGIYHPPLQKTTH